MGRERKGGISAIKSVNRVWNGLGSVPYKRIPNAWITGKDEDVTNSRGLEVGGVGFGRVPAGACVTCREGWSRKCGAGLQRASGLGALCSEGQGSSWKKEKGKRMPPRFPSWRTPSIEVRKDRED